MTEFKFRIFDNREGLKRMTYPTGFYYYGDGFEGGNPKHKFVHANYPQGAFSTFHVNDIIIMQFTGLLDKNGKEIWDGDRLKDSSGYIWVVYWYEDHACFGCYDESLPHIKHEIIDNLNFKVIGNIYENHDLLK